MLVVVLHCGDNYLWIIELLSTFTNGVYDQLIVILSSVNNNERYSNITNK